MRFHRRVSRAVRIVLMLLLTFSSIAAPASGVEGSLESSASAAAVSPGDTGVAPEPEVVAAPEPEPGSEFPPASLSPTETRGDSEEELLPSVSAEILATVQPLAEVDLGLDIMAMPENPGVYFTGGSVPLQIVLLGQSTNVHTRPEVMWTDGTNVCVAVKSTHRMDNMTLQTRRVPPATMLPPATATDFHAYPQPDYPQYQPISVDGAVYHPTGGLTGNTADSHWTVFHFPIESIDFGADLTYGYALFSTYVGQGHWVSGSFTVMAPRTSVTITKTWVDGPMTDPVDIDLERRIPGNGAWEYVDTFTFTPPSSTVVVDDLLMTDSLGRPYDFRVVEPNTGDGYELTYTPTRDAATGAFTLAATNTYTPPIVPIVATKVWEGGPAAKPAVTLQLFQDGVAWGDPAKLIHPDLTYTWNVPKTKLDGTPYTYTVQEVADPANPIPYTSAASGLTVTNTYVPPLRSFTGYKAWVGGEALGDRPAILLQLYRGATPEGDPVPFPHGKLSHTWTNLPATDFDGNPYNYHVSEVAVPTGYSESISEDGTTVTNTYTPGSTNITARKIWTGGPLPKPDIRFQLWRTHEVEGTVKAPDQDPVTLKHPTVSHTWNDLPSHATDGRPYTYTIEELEVPENYVATYTTDRLTVENRYVSPRLDIDVVKEWDGGDPDSRPTVDFQLLRNGVAQGAVKSLIPGGAAVTWNVPANDSNGVAYTYDVSEIVPTMWDYQLKSEASTTGDMTLTFTFVNEEAPRGKLTLTKQVFAHDGTPRTGSRNFQATVTGPGLPEGGRRVVLNPTRPVVIEGLEYGTYRVVEDPHVNYATTYPAQEVTIDFFDRTGELTVANTELPRGVLNIVKIHQGADKGYALDPAQEFDIRITGPAGYSLETTITSGSRV